MTTENLNNPEELPDEELAEEIVESDDAVVVPEEDLTAEAAIIPAALVAVEDFDLLELEPNLLAAVKEIGWTKPTPVQSLCLPLTVKGRDVAGFAQTGTGKTGVFLLTIAQRILKAPKRDNTDPLAIVLAPTRELALQIENDASGLFSKLNIRSLAVFGGMDYEKQAKSIRQGVDFIVATPGRLKDFLQKKEFSLDSCSIFVCDEADRMLDMGFIEDVEFFLDKLPEKCQRLLFSATTNATVKELAFEYLEKPEYVSVNPETITPENIEQFAVAVDSAHKLQVLLGLFEDQKPTCAIIFTNTKLVADWLHFKLVNNGIQADLITGDLPQRQRIQLIKKIKAGEIKALVATDVASRGLHISNVSHVFNFDLPDDESNYVHRIGRTARAGAKGVSYSFVCEDYGQNLVAINQLLGETLALKTTLFDERYLQIKDKAGNPYASRMADQGSTEGRHDRGPRDRHQRPSGRTHGDGERGNRPQRDDRGGRGGGQGRHGQGRDGHGHKDQRHQGQPRHGRDNRQDQKRPHQAHVPAIVAPVETKGVFAMLKRIFKAIFGIKS
jgi:ATP-dependent RNA helicase RhlB